MLICPRCENPIRNNKFVCTHCNYRITTKCKKCGENNLYNANYCGKCGMALSVTKRLIHLLYLNYLLSYPQKIKIKRLASGFALGFIVIIFALGSMGMTKVQNDVKLEYINKSLDIFHQNQFLDTNIIKCYKNIEIWKTNYNELNKPALKEDLISLAHIIGKHLKSMFNNDFLNNLISIYDSKPKLCAEISDNIPNHNSNYLRKIELAHFIYKLSVNLLNKPYDYSSMSQSLYIDVPSYHPDTFIINYLENLGIKLSKDDEKFLPNNTVKVSEMLQIIVKFLKVLDKELIINNAKKNNHENYYISTNNISKNNFTINRY